MHLHNKHKKISRVQVSLKRLSGIYNWKVCEISLVIDDNSILASGNANSYEHAAREAIDELAKKIDEYRINRQTVLPDVLPDTAVDCGQD